MILNFYRLDSVKFTIKVLAEFLVFFHRACSLFILYIVVSTAKSPTLVFFPSPSHHW